MTQNPSWGYRAQGVILSHETDLINWQKRIVPSTTLPILGYSNQAQQILSKESPSDVIVMMEQTDHRWLLDIVMQCRELGISVKIQPDLYEIFTGQARLLAIHGMPLIDINPELLKTWERVVKRIFDIAFSAIVLLLGLPFLLITAILVKLDSKGPIFFSQIRVGKNGKIFTMYKFRSMITDAEAEGPRWASVNDPRVTRLGRFLRKSHLDEIPQFWNVLKGEMSLVGPRPERPFFVEKFKKDVPYYLRRLVIRPGLTGWNQVHYRDYEETLEEITNRLKHDFYYIENMSLQLDVEIIIRTVIRVFRGQGQA
jgi:exopolysaccharide biosynthesis polyprenyl glycosylphosphotransferase